MTTAVLSFPRFAPGDKVTDLDGFSGIVQSYPYDGTESGIVIVRIWDGLRCVGDTIRHEDDLRLA